MSEKTLELTMRGDREIVMTRVFDAPRRLVFDAFTKPELVKQWLLGPPGWTMPVCEIDLRVGGLPLRVACCGRAKDGDGRRLPRDPGARAAGRERAVRRGLVSGRGSRHSRPGGAGRKDHTDADDT